jgi:hypothetical protein
LEADVSAGHGLQFILINRRLGLKGCGSKPSPSKLQRLRGLSANCSREHDPGSIIQPVGEPGARTRTSPSPLAHPRGPHGRRSGHTARKTTPQAQDSTEFPYVSLRNLYHEILCMSVRYATALMTLCSAELPRMYPAQFTKGLRMIVSGNGGCCQAREFSLFCAYPRARFTEDPSKSLAQICAPHSRIV